MTDRALDAAFARTMAKLGPFEPNPALTAAVSGGADSMALALLARRWARQRQGTLHALVVDHGLRPESADEARITVSRLRNVGITATVLTLTSLRRGPALAERARIMRYQALAAGCRSVGSLHLLVGHHAADQAETVMMRTLRGSLTHGLASMAALVEYPDVRLLRPLLGIQPDALRRLLRDQGVDWVEDPSNRDRTAQRSRLRQHLGPTGRDLSKAVAAIGALRSHEEAATATELASRVSVRVEGFALLSPGGISIAALASLIQMISGAPYAPSLAQIADLAASPRPATVAGVRLTPAGRTGGGLLLVREEAAIAAPTPACPDVVWDGRFRLVANHPPPAGAMIGKLGEDAPRFRMQSSLPSVVLRTLPAIRLGKILAAVPHLGYCIDRQSVQMAMLFSPRKPLAGSCFLPA